MKRLLYLLLLIPSFSVLAAVQLAPPIKVGLIETGRPPYFWPKDSQKESSGFYIDLLEAISKQAGIRFEYRYLPQARLRRLMVENDLDLEPGIDPIWRQEPIEVINSVYSIPFFLSDEVIMSHKPMSQTINKLSDLKKGKLCRILGFNYDENTQHESVTVLSEEKIIAMLLRKRCDYGVIPLDIASHLSHKSKVALYRSEPLSIYKLSMRLNKEKAHLLPEIDKAIETLIDTGIVDKLLSKYGMKEI
ncbi:hypothetical protein EOPP23_03450 [Endozoicomonas sp. OPT23]|uniref:substrate-binding periplasmic protein n=1 Tax=Endozoicomonas sp. OPT23 TaxID=2072845 RepID=UPI00129AC117|nr:transporter substrate-binding domain-containing protein [Endozoicomonas sp. OPT23]MRI32055.1 hypothetical protein [Endozoicomonas sp. OPT23]